MKQFVILLILLNFLIHETRGQNDKKQEDEKIFIDPEKIASFPGGNDSLMNFIRKNLVNPTNEKKQGKVFVAFIVNVEGTLSDAKVEKGLSPEYDLIALELIQKMPKWTPGTMYGTPVRQRFVLPINFQ